MRERSAFGRDNRSADCQYRIESRSRELHDQHVTGFNRLQRLVWRGGGSNASCPWLASYAKAAGDDSIIGRITASG